MASARWVILACVLCSCATLPRPIDNPRTPEALVDNTLIVFRRDDLLNNAFYSDGNLKILTGAEEVHRSILDRVCGHDMIERIWMTGFPVIRPPPNLERPDIPWLRFEPWREVKDGHIVRAGLFLQIRADYESDRLSSVRTRLAHGCSEDKEQEYAKSWAIAREPFNPPLGRSVPVIFSCAEDTFGLHKKMTLDFGFAVPGFDPMLDTVRIVEERK